MTTSKMEEISLEPTYLFYDIETTGLNKSFDQVLQFAAIRTDCNLKEMARYELNVRLNNDVVPSPSALITHQISIMTMYEGISELDAMQKIHRWLNQPGTISLGYNTLGFDDEFLRFSFYRNLLSPYTHQYAAGCGRMDLYPMLIMFYLFKPSGLHWPEKEGRVSLKLEELNKANQLASGPSHNAMVDVEATLALARLLFKQGEQWHYLQGYFNKRIDAERMQGLYQDNVLMIDVKLGYQASYQCPVLFLGHHQHYKNQLLWLRLDHVNFATLSPTEIVEKMYVIHKKLGEPHFVLPLAPRFLHHLSQDRLSLAKTNTEWLHHHPDTLQAIADYSLHYQYPVYPNTDIDASLYIQGFWSNRDEKICQTFHTLEPIKKADLTHQIDNAQLRAIAMRLLGRHYPDVLTSAQTEAFSAYLATIFSSQAEGAPIDFKGTKRLTLGAALAEAISLKNNSNLTQQTTALLDEYVSHISRCAG